MYYKPGYENPYHKVTYPDMQTTLKCVHF